MIKSTFTKNNMNEIVFVLKRQRHPISGTPDQFLCRDTKNNKFHTDFFSLSPPRDEAHDIDDTPSWKEKILALPE